MSSSHKFKNLKKPRTQIVARIDNKTESLQLTHNSDKVKLLEKRMNYQTQENAFEFNGREKLPLPLGYIPANDVFIVGRGRRVYEHPGNKKFRALIDATLPRYKEAPTKGLKSAILWQILEQVRNNSANRLGFVKKEAGRWHAMDDASARINIAQAFRDRLTADYRSSKKHKSIKRKVELGIPLTDSDEVTASSYNTSNCSSICSSDDEEDRPAKRVYMGDAAKKISDITVDTKMSLVGGLQMGGRQEILQQSSMICPSAESFLSCKVDNADSNKTFENLFRKFGDVYDSSENPFEPNPILPKTITALASRNDICKGMTNAAVFPSLFITRKQPNFQDDFEPIPFSVKKANQATTIGASCVEPLVRRFSISDLSISSGALNNSFDYIFEAALSAWTIFQFVEFVVAAKKYQCTYPTQWPGTLHLHIATIASHIREVAYKK